MIDDRPLGRFDTRQLLYTEVTMAVMAQAIEPLRRQHRRPVGNPIFTALKDKMEVADYDR